MQFEPEIDARRLRAKHRLLALVSVLLSIAMITAASAVEECAPLPLQEVKGHIDFVGGFSAATEFFYQNGCEWGPAEALNGSDGLVLEVNEMVGRSVTVAVIRGATATSDAVFQGRFLDDSCVLGDPFPLNSSSSETPYEMDIPWASWLLIDPVPINLSPSGDFDVVVRSEAVECPEPDEPKKKKKKKK